MYALAGDCGTVDDTKPQTMTKTTRTLERGPTWTAAARIACLVLLFLACSSVSAASRERIRLERAQISLPGAPASILATDLNGDGHRDLAIVVAFTTWDQQTIEESVELDEVEGLIEMMTVVPALADRRELHVFLADDSDGTEPFRPLAPLTLDLSVITLGLGPPGEPLFALTDDGLAGVRLDGSGSSVEIVPLAEVESILSGTRALLPDLELTGDLTGDGVLDIMVPLADHIAIFEGTSDGISGTPVSTVALPAARFQHRGPRARRYPLPSADDFDGDGTVDLVFRMSAGSWRTFWLARGLGGGRFEAPYAPLGEPLSNASAEDEYTVTFGPPEMPLDQSRNQWREPRFVDGRDDDGRIAPRISFFGDLDGQGRAEYVLIEDLSERGGFRKEMKQAKRPPVRFVVKPSTPDLGIADERVTSVTGYGYSLAAEDEAPIPGGFQDLNGDGRQDLIALTLDFTIFQAVRVLATRRLNIGIDFHLWCQRDDGSFAAVSGLDLSGRLKLRLDDLRLGQLSQFAGDFDGDGRADFVQMGRGRNVSIHRGQENCRYPAEPDLVLKLAEAPQDLALVRVGDYDGDDRSDLIVIQPGEAIKDGSSSPVRLDLYLSERGGSS